MAFNSEPNEASRKTLDEIRRELDAEYGFVELASAAPDERNVEDARRRGTATAEREMPDTWAERDAMDEARVQQISDRHRLAMGRFAAVADERPPRSGFVRSGYVIAALVGCVGGQALLLAFLTITRSGGWPDVSRTSVVVSRDIEAMAPAPRAAVEEAVPTTESVQKDDAPAAAPAPRPSTTTASSTLPSESQPANELPPRTAPEPSASSSRPPAMVSAATLPEGSRSRLSDGLPPRAAQEPRASSARRPIMGASDVADTQARLRSALNDWLRASARGGAPLQTTEPIIVLGPDGRTAKTYVSVASPVGLVPREQRWELGPRGWNLVEDRQSGLPRPAPATTGR